MTTVAVELAHKIVVVEPRDDVLTVLALERPSRVVVVDDRLPGPPGPPGPAGGVPLDEATTIVLGGNYPPVLTREVSFDTGGGEVETDSLTFRSDGTIRQDATFNDGPDIYRREVVNASKLRARHYPTGLSGSYVGSDVEAEPDYAAVRSDSTLVGAFGSLDEVHVEAGGLHVIVGAAGVEVSDGGSVDFFLQKPSYRHVQSVAAAVWLIPHFLGYKPGGVYAENSAHEQIVGRVTHLDTNHTQIEWFAAGAPVAESGEAFVS